MTATPLPPLHGVRILDLSMVWAGPYATRLLADAGAEVIKIEGSTHPDPIRASAMTALAGQERAWDRSAYFNEYGRNKLSLILELGTPEGRATFLELVRTADAVVENFRTGVLEGFNLSPAVLQAERPDLIIVSMPGFSRDGEESAQAGYGPTIEASGGLSQLTGYEGGPPHKSGISYGDPLGGILTAGALIAALLRRQRTGQGAIVEVAQRDLLVNLVGEAVLDWQMNQRLPVRRGNRHRWMAPHGCYPCLPLPESEGRPLGRPGFPAGIATDRWLTIAVATDAQWQALCAVIGRPDLAADPRYATALDRYEAQDELDAIISEWTRQHSDDEAMTLLQAAGVPAAAVRTPLTLTRDPHLAARGYYREVEHPLMGRHKVAGPLWNFSAPALQIHRSGPTFNEHQQQILGDLLGYGETAITHLREVGISVDAPITHLPATAVKATAHGGA